MKKRNRRILLATTGEVVIMIGTVLITSALISQGSFTQIGIGIFLVALGVAMRFDSEDYK